MSKTYRVTPFVRMSNWLTSTMLRLGLSFNSMMLLTAPGRRSGQPRTTPVSVIEHRGERYLVGSFGPVNWVRNLRAAGRGTLRKGRTVEPFQAVELSPRDAAPILKTALTLAPGYVRAFYDVAPESSREAFEREAVRHPVFNVVVDVPRRSHSDRGDTPREARP